MEPSPRSVEISVVIPVYRTSEFLGELNCRLHEVLASHSPSYEILFVEDACPANSLATLRGLAKSDPAVAVLALEQNVGQNRAVLTGLRYARGATVVVLDADLQDPPEAIPSLLEKLREGPSAVFAGRRGRYESKFRLLTSRLYKSVLHILTGIPKDAGLFFAMRREMVDRLLCFGEPQPFLLALIGCTGLSTASVPVARSQRVGGFSAYTFWERVRIGFLAIAWIISWKLFRGRAWLWRTGKRVAVKSFIGVRFEQSVDSGTG